MALFQQCSLHAWGFPCSRGDVAIKMNVCLCSGAVLPFWPMLGEFVRKIAARLFNDRHCCYYCIFRALFLPFELYIPVYIYALLAVSIKCLPLSQSCAFLLATHQINSLLKLQTMNIFVTLIPIVYQELLCDASHICELEKYLFMFLRKIYLRVKG